MYKKRYLFVPIFALFLTAVLISRNMMMQQVGASESFKSISQQLAEHDYQQYLKVLDEMKKGMTTLSPLDPDIVYGPNGEIVFIKGTPPPSENTGGTFFSSLGFIPITPQAKPQVKAVAAVNPSPQPQTVLTSTVVSQPTQVQTAPVAQPVEQLVAEPVVAIQPKPAPVPVKKVKKQLTPQVNVQAVGGATPMVQTPPSVPAPVQVQAKPSEQIQEKKEEKREEKQERKEEKESKEHGKK